MPENILQKITAQIKKDEKPFFDSFDAKNFPLRPRPAPVSFKLEDPQSFIVIAEVKKASPSKGVIREPFHPLEIATSYLEGGASGLSVLTEKNYFQGRKDHLRSIRKITEKPLLRKDFIFHPAQVFESYNLGADIVLLIAACLEDREMQALHKTILDFGMLALVEIHDEEDLRRALAIAELKWLGINNRNLKTFEVDIEAGLNLKKKVPTEIPVISESGITTPENVIQIKEAGFQGMLVGESLLRQADPGQGLKNLLL